MFITLIFLSGVVVGGLGFWAIILWSGAEPPDKTQWHQEYAILRHKDIQGNIVTGYVLQRKTPEGWQYRSMDMTSDEYQAWEQRA